MKHLRRVAVARCQPHGAFELMKGLPPAPLPEVNLPQVHEGELPRFVAFGLLGLFRPRDRLVQLVPLHQVDPDVVIRIAELGVDLDRPETLFGGLLQSGLEAQGPSQEGMRLGRGMFLDGALVALDRAVQLSLHLVAVGLLPELRRLPQSLSFFHFAGPPSPARLEPLPRCQVIGCLCSPNAVTKLDPSSNSLSLEGSGSISELPMPKGRPSRLRAWVGGDSTPTAAATIVTPVHLDIVVSLPKR